MLSHTITAINANKAAIAELAFKRFNATFISVLNGRDTYLQRSSFNYAHLRFTTILEKRGDSYEHLEKKDYKDNYIYYTTSTTTDTENKLDQKLKEELSDRCFNVKEELLQQSPARKCKFWFLVDLGDYFSIVSLEYAKKHVVNYSTFQGNNIATVRLPAHTFYKKETNGELRRCIGEGNFAKVCAFDAKYLQRVTYSKYRARGGFIRVETYINGNLEKISFSKSTGKLKEDFEKIGINKSQDWFRKLAKENKSIKAGNTEYKFSRVTSITVDESTTYYEDSKESGLPLQSSINNIYNRSNIWKNVMVNQSIVETDEEIEYIQRARQQDSIVSKKVFDWEAMENI